MRKKDRHRLITRLLSEQDIRKQEEFVEILKSKGISVTQATISRDIKELKLIKVPASDGGYRYSIPAETNEDVNTKLEKLLPLQPVQLALQSLAIQNCCSKYQ